MKKFKLASLATALVLSLSAFAGCGGGGNKVDNDKAWNSLNSGEIIQLVFAGRDVDTEKPTIRRSLTNSIKLTKTSL